MQIFCGFFQKINKFSDPFSYCSHSHWQRNFSGNFFQHFYLFIFGLTLFILSLTLLQIPSVHRTWLILYWMGRWLWICLSMPTRTRGSWPTWDGLKSRSCRRWWWRASGCPSCQSLPPALRKSPELLLSSARLAAAPLPPSLSPEGSHRHLHPSQHQF